MKKRVIALVVAGVTAVSMLAGCSKIDSSNAYELVDYTSYVQLGEYSGLDIEVTRIEVTDEDVQTEIDGILDDETTYEEITEGTAQDGDTINLDFAGYYINEDGSKGDAFDNGTATDQTYTIGGSFIPDLNDQLIGLSVGTEYDLTCTFPEDYGNEDLNGVTVIFTVTINYIQGDAIVPTWDNDFVNEYTSGAYTTTADYEAYIRSTLEEEAEEEMQSDYEALVWSTIIDNATISGYEEEELAKITEMYVEQLEYYVDYYAYYFGMEYEDFLESEYCYYFFGITSQEELEEMAAYYAESEMDGLMIAVEISKLEGITVPSEEYESQAQSVVDAYDDYEDIEAFEEEYGRNFFLEGLIYDKVSDWLYEQNNKVLVDEATETEAATEAETAEEATTAAN